VHKRLEVKEYLVKANPPNCPLSCTGTRSPHLMSDYTPFRVLVHIINYAHLV